MSIKRLFLALTACSFCFFGCSALNDFGTGSVSIILPQESNSARAARISEITYSINISATNNYEYSVDVPATQGKATFDGIPVGNCKITMDAYYPQAKVPCYSGSAELYINSGENNVANIKLKKIDYSSQPVVNVNIKMTDGFSLVINDKATWDFSKVLVQRIYVDGSMDDNYLPATNFYKVTLDESYKSENYIGYLNFVLSDKTGKTNYTKKVQIPTKYSLYSKANDAVSIAPLNISAMKTDDGEMLGASVKNFELKYVAISGKETAVTVSTTPKNIKWYSVNSKGKEDEITADLVNEDGTLNFIFNKEGTFNYYCTANIEIGIKDNDSITASDWIINTVATSATYTREVTAEDLKSLEKDTGTGGSSMFNVTFPEIDAENKIYLNCYVDEENGLLILGVCESYMWNVEKGETHLDPTLFEKIEFFIDGQKVDFDKAEKQDNYSHIEALLLYQYPMEKLPFGNHEISCFVTTNNGNSIYYSRFFYNMTF